MGGKDKQPNPDKAKQIEGKETKRKPGVYTTEKPFTLHIDDAPVNVARTLFDKPLTD